MSAAANVGLQPERRPTWHFLVLGHDSGSNALGRALSMALVAEQLGTVSVYAAGSSNVWRGAAQFSHSVNIISRGSVKQFVAGVAEMAGLVDNLVVWVSKGIDPLPQIVSRLKRAVPSALVVFDRDDDDAGLARGFQEQSIANRLRLNVLRRMNPVRVQRAQEQLLALADGATVSSFALADSLRVDAPFLRIPHTRNGVVPLRSNSAKEREVRTRVGAFGTIREHKGGRLLLSLLSAKEAIELVTFVDCGLGSPSAAQDNWIELPADTPLDRAYSLVDVTLIAMDSRAPGSNVQLPAKLVDAMRAGVPIVASPTAAIQEIADGGFVPLGAEATVGETQDAIRRALESDSEIGTRAQAIFTSKLSPQVLAADMREFLVELQAARVIGAGAGR